MVEPPKPLGPPPSNEPSAPPPLRIHHILVATAVTAVFLSFAQSLPPPGIGGLSAFIITGRAVMYAVSSSLALTAVGWGLYWQRKGIAFFNQPGHWLLISHSFGVWVVVRAAVVLIANSSSSPLNAWFFYATYLGMACVDLVAAWRVGDTRWWRLQFIFKGLAVVSLFALSAVLFSFGSRRLFAFAHLAIQLLVFILLIAAGMNDRRTRRQRDWVHWLGFWISLAVYIVAVFPQLLGFIALMRSF